MPYEAAKAVVANFAYHIRYVLVPIFGMDFLSICVHPQDPNFEDFRINSEIISSCAEQAGTYRSLYRKTYHIPADTPSSCHLTLPSPSSITISPGPSSAYSKIVEIESGYGTDTDSDNHLLSPTNRLNDNGSKGRKPLSRTIALLEPPYTPLIDTAQIPNCLSGRDFFAESKKATTDSKSMTGSSIAIHDPEVVMKGLSPVESIAVYALIQLRFSEPRLNNTSRDRRYSLTI